MSPRDRKTCVGEPFTPPALSPEIPRPSPKPDLDFGPPPPRRPDLDVKNTYKRLATEEAVKGIRALACVKHDLRRIGGSR